MDNCRWMVVKGNVPVQICNSIEEAETVYQKYDCDEIRRVDDDDDQHIFAPAYASTLND